jgi:hypothetical protein
MSWNDNYWQNHYHNQDDWGFDDEIDLAKKEHKKLKRYQKYVRDFLINEGIDPETLNEYVTACEIADKLSKRDEENE